MTALCRIAGVCLVALLLAFTAGTASASTRGVTLITPKTVSVTRDSNVCADSTGKAIPCLVVDGAVKNSGLNGYKCLVVLNDLNFALHRAEELDVLAVLRRNGRFARYGSRANSSVVIHDAF
jgi:hypothetical protein